MRNVFERPKIDAKWGIWQKSIYLNKTLKYGDENKIHFAEISDYMRKDGLMRWNICLKC